jgi:3-deoxy-D-manno-octulosonic-acid transferase
MHRICVPSAEQADRFIELGAHAASVAVTGHTKYDTSPSVTTEEAKRAIREEFFPGDRGDAPIIVLGSVRPGEEEWWLQAFERKNAHGTPAKMIIAPRHAEKFDYFAERLARSAVTWERWSRQSRETREIVLLDAMGQLERAYSIASLAFIGATFVDIGGHNPFEPAMYGVPVCVGPFVRNIRDLVSDMEAAAGIVRLATSVDVEVAVSRVVNGDPELAHLGEKGRDVWKRHSGAAHRVISELVGENL